ncbi:MAG: DUF5615 family PIN-like protein [Anaerolineae bacterium]|nr:DUF5615 family PIN-like protein [Anaerolineae bacterium]
MSERVRFHLDENVDPDIAKALRRHGVDVTTTVEAGLRMSNDKTQWTYAQREGRVIVTHDDDFLVLASQSTEHFGIAYCRQHKRSIGEMIEALRLIYEVLLPDELRGRVEYL